MPKARLPRFFQPHRCDDLVRLGRDHDGGYLVSRSDVLRADLLVSFGVSHDWSFERAFTRLNDCDVHAYDASVGAAVFLRNVLKSVPRLDDPRLLVRALRTYVDYGRFFRGRRRHFRQFVGIDAPPTYIGVQAALRAAGGRSSFLKIDIEGWEYRLLDQLVAAADSITGLVIELHDCDLHLARIEQFIAAFRLPLVHVHANNYSPVADCGIPLALELSFSASSASPDKAPGLGHGLDMANDRDAEEIELAIAG